MNPAQFADKKVSVLWMYATVILIICCVIEGIVLLNVGKIGWTAGFLIVSCIIFYAGVWWGKTSQVITGIDKCIEDARQREKMDISDHEDFEATPFGDSMVLIQVPVKDRVHMYRETSPDKFKWVGVRIGELGVIIDDLRKDPMTYEIETTRQKSMLDEKRQKKDFEEDMI